MENNNDFDFIKAQFSDLPDITLPPSLTAESLWARVDAGELAADTENADDTPPRGRVISWVGRMRPVLSYAAVFVLMVAVYYGAGLDNAPTAMPAPAAENQLMMALPPEPDAPKAAGAQPRMATAPSGSDTPAPAAEAPMPMLADAPVPERGADGSNANPDTSDLTGAEVEAYTMLAKEYASTLDNATAMEQYLLATLSPKDYGGMYIMQSNVVTLNIWVLNEAVVEAAIASYTGEQCEILTQAARCSLEDLKLFAGALERTSLNEGETLHAYISEKDNTVAANISKAGADRLKKQVVSLAQENNIPSECVTVFVIDPEAPNPDT